MVDHCDRCKALRLGLCVLLLATFVIGQWPTVQLDRSLRVRRGLTADINLTISNRQLTHCSFRQVPHTAHLSCGILRPASIRCDSSEGRLVYQHYGCSPTRELLYLQLLASRNGSEGKTEYHIRFFSLEVIVEDLDMRLVYLEASTRLSEGYEYTQLTPVFPPEWIGKCYYRIVDCLLSTAKVHGMVNSPLPCGYVPSEPFFLLENAYQNRSVLLEVTGTSASMPTELHLLLFANSTRTLHTPALPHTTLQVLQFANTPVSVDLLPCPHSYHQCVYVFPVLPAGVFVPAYSPTEPTTNHTKFTSEDIAAGIVMFVPNDDPLPNVVALPITGTYDYAIFDYAGHKLAVSAIEVHVLSRDWNFPSQRFLTSPQVRWGGHTSLNNHHLQFYIPPNSYCMENTFVSLKQGPICGRWTFTDERNLIIGESFPHSLLQNGSLVYRHNGGDGSSTVDGTVWTVTCDGRSFQLHMSLSIVPESGDWSPETKVRPSTLITFCGRASPLLLDTPVYDGKQGLHFDVNVSEGALVRLMSSNTLSIHPHPPYVIQNGLVYDETVTQFSIEEVQQNRIWYIPVCSAINSLELRMHSPSQSKMTTIMVQVLYATVSIEDFFLASSFADFLKIVKNQPLPVASTEMPVYISTSFLYTHSYAKLPKAVTYRVLAPPQHGHICLSSTTTSRCTQSLHDFTQADVDTFKIVYRPSNESNALTQHHDDAFVFELRYWNVGLVPPLHGLFRIISTKLEPLVPPEEQLWIEPGGDVTIPLKVFRLPHKQLLRNAIFQLVGLPQYGELFMPGDSPPIVSTSIYTFEQLKSDRLRYRHRGGNPPCSDSFSFIASNATHSVNKSVVIAFRQRFDNQLGVRNERKLVLAQDNFVFTLQDFRVLSDFCPRFVQFTMQGEPLHGLLRLFLPSLHTFVRLGNGSVFTAEDIQDGRLWYTTNSYPTTTNDISALLSDTLKFYLSDPTPAIFPESRTNFGFVVTFLQPTELIRIHTTFNIRDVYTLSWIPELGKFGYIFQPGDITVESTPDLQERNISVKILIKESPRKGWIRRGSQTVTEFYLHRMHEGEIYYVPTDWWIWVTSSDAFTISILLETNNASFFVNTVYNHSMVLVWTWVNPTQSSYLVRESVSQFQLTFRRRTDNGSCPDYESTFSLAFSPVSSATLTTDCTSGSQWSEDACIDSLDLSFPAGDCNLSVTLELAQDQEFEGPEQLLLYVVNCTDCVSNVSITQPLVITIDDTDDYAFVDVVARAAGPVVYGCSREMNVREEVGEVVLGLTRMGNMDHAVSVSCTTQADTATDNIDFGHLDRDSVVTFEPNQTEGRCVVEVYDDTIYERKERFYINLTANGGLVNTGSPLCVYIVYDPHDAPVVSFQREPLTMSESKGSSFSILRQGVNLHLDTRVCYQVEHNETFPMATPTDDFILTNDVVHNHQWCVDFAPSQTEALCPIVALRDDMLEGTEFVFLELLPVEQFGELGQPTRFNITILDGTEPVHIGLSNTTYHIEEGEGLRRFEIVRSGSVSGVNQVLCKLKPIDTTTQITDQINADFVVPRRPERVTFQPNITIKHCAMWLKDDNVYEGVERLYLELDYTPLDPRVQIIPSRQRATIYIHDDNDEPKVWFSSVNYTVQEPLSNFEVDRHCAVLTLLRGGDMSHIFTISYTTVAGSATPGGHYVPVNGTVQFEPAEEARNITVPILANEDSIDVSFRVQLLTNVTSNLRLPTAENEATVVIVNTPLTGVLFPDRPVVQSLLPNGSYATGTTLYYNAPVVCVDPCDRNFETVADTSYTTYCRDQQIDSGLTEYAWFLSSSDDNYRPVQQATIYTTFDGKILEPVYFNQSTYVRCTARAVTSSGTQGGTRLSDSVHLSQSSLSPDTCNSTSSFLELYKNDGFTGHPEELLRLTVVLKHYANFVPLISSRPFDRDQFLLLLTRPFTRDRHSCSNLVERGPQKASFLSPLFTSSSSESSSVPVRADKSQLLYQHFNSSKCRWEFRVWLPLSLLTDSVVCNAQHTEEGHTHQLTLSLSYAYVHIHQGGGVSVWPPEPRSDQVRATWESGHTLSIPFDTYPHTADGAVHDTSTHLYPISTQHSRGLLTIIFYSVANAATPIERVEVMTAGDVMLSSGRLLYSSGSPSSSRTSRLSSSARMVRQAWMLEEVRRDEGESMTLRLWHDCPGLCASTPLTFSWFIATAETLEPRIAPQLDGQVYVTDGLIEGDIWLRPYFRLRENYTLHLESVTLYLCAADNTTTCTYSQIWTIQHADERITVAAGFDMNLANKTLKSFNFTFKDEPLHQLGLMGLFQVQVKCSIQSLSDNPNTAKSPIPPLTLYFNLRDPDQESRTTSGAVSHSVALLASSITIFLTAAVLVTVVLVVVWLQWRWQTRRKHRDAVENRGNTDGSLKPREQQDVAEYHPTTPLRKSYSTTSFPTVEKLKTTQGTPKRSSTSQMTGQINRGLSLSKSLPNLFLVSGSEAKLCRKRQLRKNVRVKAIYSLQASLDKKQMKGGGGEGSKEPAMVGQVDKRGEDSLKQDGKLAEVRKMGGLQACVIKNSVQSLPPILVCVQPLTGERDTDVPAALEPGSMPKTEP